MEINRKYFDSIGSNMELLRCFLKIVYIIEIIWNWNYETKQKKQLITRPRFFLDHDNRCLAHTFEKKKKASPACVSMCRNSHTFKPSNKSNKPGVCIWGRFKNDKLTWSFLTWGDLFKDHSWAENNQVVFNPFPHTTHLQQILLVTLQDFLHDRQQCLRRSD